MAATVAIQRARFRYVRFVGEAIAFALLLAVIFIACAIFE